MNSVQAALESIVSDGRITGEMAENMITEAKRKEEQIEAAWAMHSGKPTVVAQLHSAPEKPVGKVIFANREEINACWMAYAQRKKIAEASRKAKTVLQDGKFHNLGDLQAALAKPKKRAA